MKTIILSLLLSLTLSSCMHTMMMTDHHRSSEDVKSEPVLQKEVIAGPVKAVATFPPMQYGEETVFSLRLADAGNFKPIRGATVFAYVEFLHPEEANDTSYTPSKKEHEINWNQEVEETDVPGVYEFVYRCYQPGEHTIGFEVTAIGERKLDVPLVVEATRTIPPEEHSHDGGMMGMSGTTTLIVAGAVLMSAMMIGMFIAGGHRF